MTEQQSIRDELAATIHENFNACRGRGGVSPDALAQVILDSPVIRRIQAEAAAKALCDFADAVRMPATLFYDGDGPITANDLLRQRAAAIERGDR